MAPLEEALDKDSIRRFLMEQKNTNKELVTEIKTRYAILKGCSLQSIKRFCNHQGNRERMPVLDGVLDIAVRTALSEVTMCSYT